MDPQGNKWPPSKAAQRRAVTGKGGGTLFDSGKLFRSLQLSSESDDSRSIGTNATSAGGFPYPLVHNFGLAGFPQRQFLGFADDDITLMVHVVLQHIVTELQK
jgi:phage gpG-like protein